MKLFLSHASDDGPLVREFRRKLPGHFGTWHAESNLVWGADLKDALHEAIRDEVAFFIVFVDRQALKSEWVEKELAWAREREAKEGGLFILPILVADQGDEIPDDFKGRLGLHLWQQDEASVDKLVADVERHLTRALIARVDSQIRQARGALERAGPERNEARAAISKLRELMRRDDFLPKLVIGIARSGLEVAAHLSEELGNDSVAPVITLWPKGKVDIPNNRFANPFNSIGSAVAEVTQNAEPPVPIAIVDDIGMTGGSLNAAKAYVSDVCGSDVVVRSAAMFGYRDDSAVYPDYLAFEVDAPAVNYRGEVER